MARSYGFRRSWAQRAGAAAFLWSAPFLLMLCVGAAEPASDGAPSVAAASEPSAVAPVVAATNAVAARVPAPEDGPTLQQVEAMLEAVKGDAQIDDETRKRLGERFESARTILLAAMESRRKAEAASQWITQGPDRVLELGRQLQALDTAMSNELAALRTETGALGVDALTQRLAVEQAAEARLKSDLEAVSKRSTALETSATKGREERAALEQRIKAADAEAQATPAGLPPREAEALQWVRRATRSALLAELGRMEQELLSLPIETKVRLAERSLLTRQLERQQARLKVLEEVAQRAREAEVRQVRRETAQAEQRLRNEHPAVRALAATNQWYAGELESSERMLARARSAATALEAQRARLDEEVARTERQLAIAGLSAPMGEFLLDQRRRLIEEGRVGPSARVGDEEFRVSVRMVSTNGLRRFHAEERLRALAGVEDEVADWYRQRVTPALSEPEETAVRGQLQDLFVRQRDYVSRLVTSYGALMEALSDALSAQTALVARQEEYLRFLEQQLIWIPSSPAVSWRTFSALPESLRGILGEEGRRRVIETLRDVQRPGLWAFLTAVAAAWIAFYRRCGAELLALADQVRRVSTDSPLHTFWGLLLSALVGAPPGILLALAGRAMSGVTVGGTSRAVAEGLQYCGGFLAVAMTASVLVRPRGVAEAHFRWPSASLEVLRRNLRWWIPVHAILTLLAATAVHDSGRDSYDSLARLVFLMGMVALAVMLGRLMHPDRGVIAPALAARPEGWPSRTRRFWYPLVTGLPLALGVLAAAGYTYTALRLTYQWLATLGFVVASVVAYEVVKRWFAVAERRIALEQALERRREARASREGVQEATTDGGNEGPLPVEEPNLDLATVKEQTRRLLRVLLGSVLLVGLYLLWAPFLPALAFLDQKAIWTVTTTVDGSPSVVAITLSSILGAVIVVLLTVAAVQNLPGVLEIAILEKLPLQPGSRYAITAIVSYVLILVGVILAAGNLGVRWSQLTWIVAALSVGLGFGLQEIVANFVCGLLIFFERPVRVGDIVTVNEITGVVSQIRIRATTIVDWDRKEYIVPNKEFITGRILNWTLSNTVNRMVITVGIAYGSNIERAVTLMREVAERHPEVMKDPAATCFFEAFDASSLRLVLRFFLPRLDRRLPTLHEIHTEIERRFRAEGIEIAFPQQDVHIRTLPASTAPSSLHETFAGRGLAGLPGFGTEGEIRR